MALSARARELLGLTLVVLLVMAVATAAQLATLARLSLGSAADEGRLLSRQLLHQAGYVLQAAGVEGPAALQGDSSLRGGGGGGGGGGRIPPPAPG